MHQKLLATLLVSACSTFAAQAHEFWIDPVQFQVPVGENAVADLRVGQDYEGGAFSFFPKNFKRFEVALGDEVNPVESRLGDRPALNQALSEGLNVVVHETTDSRLTYDDMTKFLNFVKHKDAEWTLTAHAERGLPEEKFVEIYSRYAKSLVAVGGGAGSDRVTGLEIELVAKANPYTDDVTGGMPVELFYQAEPRPDAQIEVYEKAPDGTVTVSTVRTDANGNAVVPVKPGHRYMVDSVVLREPSEEKAEATNAVWESLWANLTFAVPE